METSFSNVMNHPDRPELATSPMIIQQYARYPTALEPTLQSASSAGSARNRIAASNSPPLHRKGTPRSLQPSPTGLRSVIAPASAAHSGPSMSPPAVDPLRRAQSRPDQAESRTLPSRDLTDQTIDDAYVAFIFYCNPSVPLSVNTYDLRRTFRCPPRSDGKSFSVFTLWELIRKLDSKELKTWIQLSMELGVEPPSLEKKQSAQKVQQYAVRLKRWMRAMHVDAFFEYCLGHFHPYYTQIPRTSAPSNETRDGVPLEEDLALRALVPEWKPKRGRKRTDGKENSEEGPSKRPQLDTSDNTLHPAAHSVVFPHSAIPFSAFPDDMESNDPWMAAASSFGADSASDAATAQQGQEIRWRSLERDASPTAYPQSAVIPRRQRTSEVLPSTEPRSAVTPSSGEKPRSRRRHGPAVSSAWLSNSGSSNGKTRGRPPNKGTAAGPFSSFPAKPSGGQQPGQQSDAKSPPRIVLGNDTPYQQSPTPIAPANVKPSKLQLQVPQHPGGPVRLATPPRPPANGADDEGHLMMEGKNTNISSDPAAAAGNSPSRVSLASDEVIRILSTELLAGNLVGRSTPLSGDEARALASSVVTNLVDLYSKCSLGSPILMAALHLGQGHHFGFTRVAPDSITVIVSAGPPNMEGSALPGVDGSLGNATYTITYEYKHPSHISTRVTCGDIHIGGMGTETEAAAKLNSSNVKELDDTEDAEFEVDSEEEVSEATWKLRYMKLRTQLQKKERSLSQYKRKILESVMADI